MLGTGACSRPAAPTYARDIAPILNDNCVGCHRAGEVGPFSLESYAGAKRQARLIGIVTESRYMPPWLPRSGDVELRGRRGLSSAEIDRIRRWVAAGAPRGDPADLPDPPEFPAGWSLGEPDLQVTLDEAYELSAEGFDVFRNFVMRVPVDRSHWISSVEFRPGNPRIVHHALMMIDRTAASRHRDSADPEPGFPGMDFGSARSPDGHFLGWTPGRTARHLPEGTAFRVGPGNDLVLQLHMVPSGKVETIRPVVGLHFAAAPPRRQPSLIILTNPDIDIPAGEASHRLADEIELPVDVAIFGVYPHAHYLGKQLRAEARLPDGTVRTLLDIPNWDFNWQDEYQFVEPILVPAGTRLAMRYRYDNSADNPRNPNDPPQRVTLGERSVDEMGTLTFFAQVRDHRDRALLDETKARHRLEKDPNDAQDRGDLGNALLAQNRLDEALAEYVRAVELDPRLADAHYNLAVARSLDGDAEEAERRYRRCIALNPDHALAHNNLGNLLLAGGDAAAAARSFLRAAELQPDLALAHYNRGLAMIAMGRLDEAAGCYRDALAVNPGYAMAANNLGTVLHEMGRVDEAIEQFRRALRIDPTLEMARQNLDRVEGR